MKNFLILFVAVCVLSACGTVSPPRLMDIGDQVAAVELDADSNGAIDEGKGGLNANTYAGMRANLDVENARQHALITSGDPHGALAAHVTEHAPSTAEQNVQSDWTQTDTEADDFIKNKPSISSTSLIVQTPSDAGQGGCLGTGIKIDTGLDNGDGGGIANDEILQVGEIDDTEYVCDAQTVDFPFEFLSNYTNYAELETSVGANPTTVFWDSVEIFTVDPTIPKNMELVFTMAGGVVADNTTVTIGAKMQDTLSDQVFASLGTGKVVFSGTGSTDKVRPEWFGGKAGDGLSDSDAVKDAVQAAKTGADNLYIGGPELVFSPGVWEFSGVVVDFPLQVTGVYPGAIFKLDDDTAGFQWHFTVGSGAAVGREGHSRGFSFKNVQFSGDSLTYFSPGTSAPPDYRDASITDASCTAEGVPWPCCGATVETSTCTTAFTDTSFKSDFMWMSFTDHFTIENVIVEFLQGSAFDFKTGCREANISDVVTRFVGDEVNQRPVWDIVEEEAQHSLWPVNGNDSHNNLYFNNITNDWPLYTAWKIGVTPEFYCDGYDTDDETICNANTIDIGLPNRTGWQPYTSTVRHIWFSQTMDHGVIPSINGSPYTLTPTLTDFPLVYIGDRVRHTKFMQSRFYSAGYNSPHIEIAAQATESDVNTTAIISSQFYPHSDFGTKTTGNYPAISIGNSVLISDSNEFYGNSPMVQDTVDSKVYWSSTNVDSANNTASPKNGTWIESSGGTGDMLASVYDPQAVAGDSFARANHTGTQAISTVSGLQAALDGKQSTAGVSVVFASDLSDGGASFDSITNSGAGPLTVTAEQLKYAHTGGVVGANVANETFTVINEGWLRTTFKIDTEAVGSNEQYTTFARYASASGEAFNIRAVADIDGNISVFKVGVYRDGGTKIDSLITPSDGTITANQTYSIDIYFKAETSDGADDGVVDIYVDGDYIGGQTGVGNFVQGQVNNIRTGAFYTTFTNACNTYVDDISIDVPVEIIKADGSVPMIGHLEFQANQGLKDELGNTASAADIVAVATGYQPDPDWSTAILKNTSSETFLATVGSAYIVGSSSSVGITAELPTPTAAGQMVYFQSGFYAGDFTIRLDDTVNDDIWESGAEKTTFNPGAFRLIECTSLNATNLWTCKVY